VTLGVFHLVVLMTIIRVMRKQCLDCRTTTNAEAPYCYACGCPFAKVPSIKAHPATWKGRMVAAAMGLLVATIIQSLHG